MDPVEQVEPLTAALFPLPNVVLFPRAVLPLHIFEERYKVMTADALAGTRQIAMALLERDWERDYYARPPIRPFVCIGTILSHERLPDGKYNFLLQGHTRARIEREILGKPYRVAELTPLHETPVLEIDLSDERRRLVEFFESRLSAPSGLTRQFQQLLAGPLTTAEIADLVAFTFFDDVQTKQSLLEETNVRLRVKRIVSTLSEIELAALGGSSDEFKNPNLN